MTNSMQAIFALPRSPLDELPTAEPSRRLFLKIAGGSGAGLVLGLAPPLPGLATVAQAASGPRNYLTSGNLDKQSTGHYAGAAQREQRSFFQPQTL